jgi:hypothetical protein
MFAVAGAGKTSFVIDDVDPDKRNIILGYTHANIEHIKKRLISRFSIIPPRTKVLPFFQFLYSFCYRPILAHGLRTKGLIFTKPELKGVNKTQRGYYITKKGYIYHNRLAHLIRFCNRVHSVHNRINEFYDKVYIDEVQDFASHDFDFILDLAKLDIPVLAVGDFYQHTFDSSRDRNKRSGLHGNYQTYQSSFVNAGWKKDTTTLVNSYRCSPTVCEFIKNNLGIEIYSNKLEPTIVTRITDKQEARKMYEDNSIVKLFIRNHHVKKCFSNNWGLSKGEDGYQDVCIIMTDGVKKCMTNGDFSSLQPTTLKKLYVACSRANRNLYFIDRMHVK